jgi:hypothetical protein
MLISMCSCALGYFRVDIFSIFRVIALDLVKFCNFQLVIAIHLVQICNFQIVSHVTYKGFDLESWNFTVMLTSMCSCTPGYFRVDSFSNFRVIALDLEKFCNFQLVSHVTQNGFDIEWHRVIKPYGKVPQHM